MNTVATDQLLQCRLGLRDRIEFVPRESSVELHSPYGVLVVRGLDESELNLLRSLVGAAVDVRDIPHGRVRRTLQGLTSLVTVTIADHQANPLIVATPINRNATAIGLPQVDPAGTRLSRFAYLRRDTTGPRGEEVVLESPVASHRMSLPSPEVAALVVAMSAGRDLHDAADRAGVSRTTAEIIASVLAGAGFLDNTRDDELQLWEFHDLLFHVRSRYGLHDQPGGGVFAHTNIEHAPALAEHPGLAELALPVPDWDEVNDSERTLTQVMEDRRSYREYDPQPITVAELGEFLYRTARVRFTARGNGDHPYVQVGRPYPMGGELGELEVYPIVHECDGLEPGIYWYDSAAHRLVLRSVDPGPRNKLLAQAWVATGGQVARPQVQLCITSRLARVQWKYSSIAYAVTLKHVGVLLQTQYLVATAMGLSPCANGSGDSDLISRAIGIDWTEEPPVGEFLLGGAPRQQAPHATDFTDVVPFARGELT